MSDLGNLYFDILLRDMTDADIDKIKKKLEKVGIKVGADVDKKTFIANIKSALKNKTFKVNLEANKKIKKAAIEANKTALTRSVSDALRGKTFSADLKLVIKTATVQDAIRQAFDQAGMQYNTTASDVRAQRVAEIQQRMALRAAQAQRRVGDAHRYAASGAYESARASVTLGRSFHSNIRLAGELGTAMGNFASVFGINDLLQGVIKIGGQLENQRIALGAILQDGGKATEMFSKIQSLAVKSPFGIMDLNQYTKQLSAYGIQYNELYETMKRMADISAGVGVDMGRIILAFGQVRAAGFLKGTELRQFTEANIPMVEKLAEKFSLLEKRIVSAGEVYDMVSKKKVTFQDVKDVLWDLTDEGGMFFNMQEVLSESLASKWKNLSDAIDVMYGKIADGMIGDGLKSIAEILTELTKGWEYVSTAISSATISYVAYKSSVLLGSKQMAAAGGLYGSMIANKQKEAAALRIENTYRKLNKTEQLLINTSGRLTNADIRQAVALGTLNKQQALQLIALGKIDKAMLRGVQRTLQISNAEIKMAQSATWGARATVVLGNAFRSLGVALKGLFLNPMTWIFGGLTAALEVWSHFSQKQDEIEQRNKEVLESAKGSITTLEAELKKFDSIEIGKLNDDELRIKISEITTVIKNEATGWQSMLSEVFAKDADGNFVNSAYKQLELLEDKMKDILEAKKYLLDNSDLVSNMIEATDGWFDESVVENAKDYSNAITEVKKQARELAVYQSEISNAINNAAFYNPDLSNKLKGKDLYEQLLILREYKDEWRDFVAIIGDSQSEELIRMQTLFNTIAGKSQKAKDTLLDDVAKSIETLKKAMNADGVTDFNNIGTKWQQIVINVATKIVDEAGVQEPKIRQAILDMWLGAFNIQNDFGYTIPEVVVTPQKYDASKDEVAKIWKKRSEEIEKAVSLYEKWKEVEGKDNAFKKVSSKKEFDNLFNGKYGFKLNPENPEESYKVILSKLDLSKSAQHELAIKLGVKLDEATINDAKTQLNDFLEKSKKFIDDTTKKWDLYKDIFKATGNKTISANIAFGGSISFKDQLDQLKAEIEKELVDTGISFDKLIGMSTEELEGNGLARFKNLVEAYNKESMKMKEESVKNFISIVNASKDFAQQIADIERELQKDLADLAANSKGMSNSELERRRAELIKRAEEYKVKVQFEEFKESSDWVKVFDDLDRVSDATLDNMISKIEEYAKQAHLSEEVTKQLVEAMGKLRDEAIERNPLEGFKDAWKRASYWRNYDVNAVYNKQYSQKTGKFEQKLSQEQVDNNLAEANDDLKDSALAVADKFQAVANAADLLSGLFENLGIDLGGISDIFGGASSGAQAGAGIASAFGMAGPWGAIAGAAVGMLSSVFSMHDKALQKEIEASEEREKLIRNISDNLEAKFETNLGGMYTMGVDPETKQLLKDYIKRYELYASNPYLSDKAIASKESYEKAHEALRQDSYYDAQKALLQLQRDELEHQMQLEDEKKKTDKSKIADYQQQIKEIEAEIENLALETANALYGIDFKGWANQLAESLVDAWSKGEDAVEAYKNTVNDILRDVGVSVISQKILEPLLNSTMESFLAQFDKDNGKLTDKSMEILAGMADGAEYAASATEAYLEGLKKLGIDLSETADSENGGLSKGIQSVTEDTANLLGSYLQAIRQDVSVKRSLVEKLIGEDVPKMNYIAEAQLRELSQIQANTARNVVLVGEIRDLVNRVVDKGSNKLKV